MNSLASRVNEIKYELDSLKVESENLLKEMEEINSVYEDLNNNDEIDKVDSMLLRSVLEYKTNLLSKSHYEIKKKIDALYSEFTLLKMILGA